MSIDARGGDHILFTNTHMLVIINNITLTPTTRQSKPVEASHGEKRSVVDFFKGFFLG